MKTLKLKTVISLVLIIAGINFLFAIPTNNRILIGSASGITYIVSVHFQEKIELCNSYLVQVVDDQGYSVAPAQLYQQGTATYVFHERGPAGGVRVARLVQSPTLGHITCNYDLVTAPDIKTGKFLVGRSYFFDLYPVLQTLSTSIQPSK